jgi:chemotaxis protein CheC
MNEWDKLKPVHQDFLKEMENIGAGHAATALSQMLDRTIGMEVPEVTFCNIEELCQVVGEEEELVSCISIAVTGDISFDMIFILKYESALSLANNLMKLPLFNCSEINTATQSVLNEVGNILIGSFLNALNSLTGLNTRSSVPAFANDMLGAVISAALLERGYYDDEVMVIGTRFYDNKVVIDGHLFMLPRYNVLKKIFESVGIKS